VAFNLRNMLTSVQSIVAALPTVTTTSAQGYMGVPESFSARINYFITLGPATPVDNAMGGQQWEPQVTVVFGYRVAANESTAELIVADLILELTDAILGPNGDPSLGGTVRRDETTLDMSGASMPEYRAIAGSEARLYPVTITGCQQRTV
jgi:hypothetical protein